MYMYNVTHVTGTFFLLRCYSGERADGRAAAGHRAVVLLLAQRLATADGKPLQSTNSTGALCSPAAITVSGHATLGSGTNEQSARLQGVLTGQIHRA